MKIALISQNASPGLLIFRKDLIKLLVSQGHQVFAFAYDYDAQSRAAVQALGAEPVSYRLSRTGLNPAADLISLYQLYKALNGIRPDVAISFFVKPSIYGTIAAKMAGAKVAVAMIEGLGYLYTNAGPRRSLKKRLLQLIHRSLSSAAFALANKVLVLNQDDHRELQANLLINKSKLLTFGPIGLNLAEYGYHEAKPSKPLHFIFIGRLLQDKGVEDFVRAAKLLTDEGFSAKFTILGAFDGQNPSGLNPATFQSLISDSPIDHYGHVDDVKAWLINADVFVLPSYREGYPRSTQEAMAIGRAVITTNVNGCRETVLEGQNGFIVEPRSVSELAAAMRKLIEKPEQIESMGRRSRELAETHYDADQVNQRLLKLCGIQQPAAK